VRRECCLGKLFDGCATLADYRHIGIANLYSPESDRILSADPY